MRPCASKSAIHVASFTSVLRPGTFLMCIAFASTRSKLPSSTCQTGCQYTPVASIATWVTPRSLSHSDNASNSVVVAPKVRTSCDTARSPATRAHATTVSRCTSSPAHLGKSTSMWPSIGKCRREPTSSKSSLRASGLSASPTIPGARGAPGPPDLRARDTKNEPTSTPTPQA